MTLFNMCVTIETDQGLDAETVEEHLKSALVERGTEAISGDEFGPGPRIYWAGAEVIEAPFRPKRKRHRGPR